MKNVDESNPGAAPISYSKIFTVPAPPGAPRDRSKRFPMAENPKQTLLKNIQTVT